MAISKMTSGQSFHMWQGALPALFASMIWGIGYFLEKQVLKEVSAVYISLITVIVVPATLYCLYDINLRSMYKFYVDNLRICTSLAILGTTLGGVLMLLGINYTSLGVATILEKVQPIFAILIARVVLKEELPAKLIPYALCCLISSYCVATKDPFNPGYDKTSIIGIICVLGAALCWAFASVLGKSISRKNIQPHEIVFILFLIGGIFMLPLFLIPVESIQRFTPSYWNMSIIVFSAIFSTALGFVLYYKSLKSISVGLISFLELGTPLTTILLGYLFLGEEYNWTQILASVALLYSVYKLAILSET